MAEQYELYKVGRWMSKSLTTVEASATVIEAMHLMKDRKVRRLPVMHDGKIAGVITEKMIKDYEPSKATSLDTWELHYLLSNTEVSKVMNPDPARVTANTDLVDAAKLLHDDKLNGVLVVDEAGELVGIFTTTNALEALIVMARH